MADQFGRPASDIALGNFVPTPSSPATGWDKLDEVSPSDADYVSSPSSPSAEAYEFKFSSLVDPVSSANHDINYRLRKDVAAGAQINATVELREGVSTLIKQWTHNDLSNTWTTFNQTLSALEADSITDYTDLRLKVIFTQV
jgi:hypothetical protein